MISARYFGADEAFQMGLVNFVMPRDEIRDFVTDYAMRVAANAPLTIRAARAAIADVIKDPARQDRAGVQALIDQCFDSDDYREGRRAFAEKRSPAFKGT
jgi:enoyl-CoA hydratase